MQVTATEIKNNFGKYLVEAQTADISITRNGKIIAILKSFESDKFNQLEKLTGIIDLPKGKKKATSRKARL
ncbi:MAG: type II toxin-antitoxin system Phd/YefM family antitoxin [Streptococcaceae bacterium]|jgi:prevent-host-death family protein|nr:type II toxin-antitoxin system Phd/YefM family antitoxin [Streptococcaceae bacterium]